MVTERKRSWRLTDRGRVVILLFVTLVAILLALAVERSQAASAGFSSPTASYDGNGDSGARSKPKMPCTDPLVVTLKRAGFTGRDLREAWAIAMRESGGREDLVSHSVDHGLFQFNIDAHRDKHWWNTKRLLTADYNARVAYLTSRGGKDWLMWGLTPNGQTDARMYPMWDEDKVERWITEPFQRYFEQFGKLPRGCRG